MMINRSIDWQKRLILGKNTYDKKLLKQCKYPMEGM